MFQLILVILAAIGLYDQFQRDFLFKKRNEIAEKGLITVTKAINIIKYIRSPAIFDIEFTGREQTDESGHINSIRNQIYARTMRANLADKIFEDLTESEYLFTAYFGIETKKHFEAITGRYLLILRALKAIQLNPSSNRPEWELIDSSFGEKSTSMENDNERDLQAIALITRPYLTGRSPILDLVIKYTKECFEKVSALLGLK